MNKTVQTLLSLIDLLSFHIKNPPCHKALCVVMYKGRISQSISNYNINISKYDKYLLNIGKIRIFNTLDYSDYTSIPVNRTVL